MKIVHVTSEANARPIITAFTMISAERNIDQGESSCSVAFSGLEASAAAVPLSPGAVEPAAGAVAVAVTDVFESGPGALCWANAIVPVETNISTATVLR